MSRLVINPSVPIRILVVEDHEAFRSFLRATIQEDPELQIISEAPDGFEAIQRAEELQPDLVFLDIGLPVLNGIEVAKRIRKIAPNSAIIFLTQESSCAFLQEAFRLGAKAYVVKSDVSEILTATHIVLKGGRYLSSSLVGYELSDAADD